MLLLDAVFINNGGGKVLLDYLILSVEKAGIEVVYLFDDRVRNNHSPIRGKEIHYIKASMYRRHLFYKKHEKRFNKVFCFGNIPPSIKLDAEVIVYLHQTIFINQPRASNLKNKLTFYIKSSILGNLIGNSNKWLVQSNYMKAELINKFPKISESQVIIAPFYPPTQLPLNIKRVEYSFLYVSSGAIHKNHIRLLEAFKIFYNKYQIGELNLTVGEQFKSLNKIINTMKDEGYPVINHGNIPRDELVTLYCASKFQIFPSIAESFGLGLIEALECGCLIIGSDLPYLHSVCDTPFFFNPFNVESIVETIEAAIEAEKPFSYNLTKDSIGEIINILK